MDPMYETAKRAGLKISSLEFRVLGLFFLPLLFSWFLFFKHGHAWLFLLPVISVPIIYPFAKKTYQQIEATKNALPYDAKVILERHDAHCKQARNKALWIVLPIMIPVCLGILIYHQYRLEQKSKADLQELLQRVQSMHQQKTAPASRR